VVQFELELSETDVTVREKHKTPVFSYRDFCDFSPLSAFRYIRAKHEQFDAISDAFAMGSNLVMYRCDLSIQHRLFFWGKFIQNWEDRLFWQKGEVI
jgi:hypothetical protein